MIFFCSENIFLSPAFSLLSDKLDKIKFHNKKLTATTGNKLLIMVLKIYYTEAKLIVFHVLSL